MADLTYLPGRIFSTGETLLGLYTDYYRSRGYYLYSYDENDYIPSLQFSGVLSLDVNADGEVVSVPVEKGSFAAYNKVERPLEIRAVMAFEGEDADLQKAVETLRELKSATNLLTFTTPQQEFESLNLQSFAYNMQADNGTNVLFAELRLVEVREVEPQYTDATAKQPITQQGAKKASDTSTLDTGKKQVEKAPVEEESLGHRIKRGLGWDSCVKKAKQYKENLKLSRAADELAAQIP